VPVAGGRPWVERRPWEHDRRGAAPPPRPHRGPPFAPVAPPADDEELIAGRRPVEEAFVAERDARRLLVTPQRRHALEQIVLHATRLRIPIVEVEGGSLTAVAGFDGHQGVALIVGARQFASLEDILARAIERGEAPFILVLDSLEDPQNVGTLLRSAEAAGVHGVVFPTRRQAPLTPAAIKASAGAVEHLLLAPVDDLAGSLADLHARGLRIAGAEEGAPLTARQTDLRGPLAIVVGSEGQGLGPAVRRRCDTFMRIPMRGRVGSLNVAVAGSILVFEAATQRDPDGASAPALAPTAFDRLAAPTEPDETEPEPSRPTGSDEAAAGEASADGPPETDRGDGQGPAGEAPADGPPTADRESDDAPPGDELLPGGPPAEAPAEQ